MHAWDVLATYVAYIGVNTTGVCVPWWTVRGEPPKTSESHLLDFPRTTRLELSCSDLRSLRTGQHKAKDVAFTNFGQMEPYEHVSGI